MKEVIDKIISDFNFEKVHRVMQTLNWWWATTDGVPSIGELVTCAQKLLYDVSKMSIGYSIGMGGFRATKIDDEDEGEGLKLEFILTRSSYCESYLQEE